MKLSPTAEHAIRAYGGVDLWRGAKYLEGEVSVTGLAFRLKRRPFFDHARIVADVHEPISRIRPIGRDASIAGVLNGHDVRLVGPQGEVLAERIRARECFSSLRRIVR